MQNLWKIVGIAGLAILIWSIVGRTFGSNTLGGSYLIKWTSALLVSQSLMLIAVLLKLAASEKNIRK